MSLGLIVLSSVGSVASASAEQLYFYVKNNSNSTIKQLWVAEPKKSWGDLDIGTGISPGENAKMVWDVSTNNQACKQWIKAKFADGSESEPTTINFCENLNEPIVFN